MKLDIRELRPDHPEPVGGNATVLGVYKPGYPYKKESLLFFRSRVGDDVYSKAMSSDAGKAHHYAVARVFLNQNDWEKFCWIEQFGSLEGFPEY